MFSAEDMQAITNGLNELDALHAAGAFDDALTLIDSLIEQYPYCAMLWTKRGKLMQLADDDKISLNDIQASFERACILAPSDPEPQLELGYFLYAVQDDAKAGSTHFAAAVTQADDSLRDALAGHLRCAVELGDDITTTSLLDRMRQVFSADDLDALCDEIGIKLSKMND